METVNVAGLQTDPNGALHKAHEDVVLVLEHDQPDVLMIGTRLVAGLDTQGAKLTMVTALFRDGHLSLARAARIAETSAGEFATYLSRLRIPVVDLDTDEAERDLETLESWLASS